MRRNLTAEEMGYLIYQYNTCYLCSGLNGKEEYHFVLFLIDEFKKEEFPTDKDIEDIEDDWAIFLNNSEKVLRKEWREAYVRPLTQEEQDQSDDIYCTEKYTGELKI